jgi:hypothetical protein
LIEDAYQLRLCGLLLFSYSSDATAHKHLENDTLAEVCSKFIIQRGIPIDSPGVPDLLVCFSSLVMDLTSPKRRDLTEAKFCALCGDPVVWCYREFISFEIVASYHRVPLLFRICNKQHQRFHLCGARELTVAAEGTMNTLKAQFRLARIGSGCLAKGAKPTMR